LNQSLREKIHYPQDSTHERFPSAPGLNITTPGVTKLLKRLKPGKAAGPDGIRPLVLKELAEELSPLITALFRKSYDTGSIPAEWKTANITPNQHTKKVTEVRQEIIDPSH
jgi:hypothetical protein